jgi:Caenorhabditis protein of unknown function, DUF268
MKRYLRGLYFFMVLFGLDPRKTIQAFHGLPFYFRDLMTLKRQKRQSDISFPFGRPYPCPDDRFASSGTAKGHYFHQDLLVARKIFKNNPTIHLDVGSRFDGFVAHVASFRFIEVIDIRPLNSTVPNVRFIQCDLMRRLPASLVNYCDSLSCLHALEHFGLGRYGDDVIFNGHLIGFDNLHSILKVYGKLYFSVPIGPMRIEFNGHRVFSVRYLLELIGNRFRIDSFSFVDDKGDLFEDVELTDDLIENNCRCHYGCGIFEMTKIEVPTGIQ